MSSPLCYTACYKDRGCIFLKFTHLTTGERLCTPGRQPRHTSWERVHELKCFITIRAAITWFLLPVMLPITPSDFWLSTSGCLHFPSLLDSHLNSLAWGLLSSKDLAPSIPHKVVVNIAGFWELVLISLVLWWAKHDWIWTSS